MGLGHSPRIITDGMVLCLDAANPRNFDLTKVEVLVVAGGGGGSSGAGGGGGAGGLIYNPNFAIAPGTQLTVTVGNGGAGGGSYPAGGYSASTPGGDSIFGSLTAAGGGNGGGQDDSATNGGSGGGGGGGTNQPTQQVAGTGTAGQGNDGAAGIHNTRGGGGGGSGSSGSVVTGGSSTNISISGTSITYAGGGGAGTYYLTAGNGGGGGAGNGTQGISVRGGDALVNTGSGGGGGGGEGSPLFRTAGGGAGGSGIIIVRYQGPQKAIGGVVTSVGGDTIHTFTTSGNFTPLVNTNGSAVLGLSDLSGNRNFGATANSPTYNTANGGALVFDGVNDFATIEANSLFQLGSGYTLCAWVKASNNPGDYAGICGTFDVIPSPYFGQNFAILPSSQRFSFAVSGWSGGSLQYIDATTQYTIARWYYLVGTNLGVNCNFYIDGNLDTTYTQAAVASNPGPTTKFKIGRYYQNVNGYYFPGNIAAIKYYNRALSATEVSQNFNALRGRFGI